MAAAIPPAPPLRYPPAMARTDPDAVSLARAFRGEPTLAEAELWRHLRLRQLNGYRFRRQHPIGPYFADFACLQPPLVVELDGSQHLEHPESDRRRDAYMAEHGFRTLRFTNDLVFTELDAVLEVILAALEGRD